MLLVWPFLYFVAGKACASPRHDMAMEHVEYCMRIYRGRVLFAAKKLVGCIIPSYH